MDSQTQKLETEPKRRSNVLSKLIHDFQLKYYRLDNRDKSNILMSINRLKFDRKIPLKCKPIEYIKTQSLECSICNQDYRKQDSISRCMTCKQDLHSDCLISWSSEQLNFSSEVTCPFCRAPWQNNRKLYYPHLNDNTIQPIDLQIVI